MVVQDSVAADFDGKDAGQFPEPVLDPVFAVCELA